MDARCAEMYSKVSNVKMTLDTFSIAYKHAINSGFPDNEFETVTIDDLERVIPELEEETNKTIVNSQIVVQQLQRVVAAAVERKKARKEEVKEYEVEEPAREKSKGIRNHEEAISNP
ncbi:hypothetical protein AALP_AA3G325000 [Arabis alpina]|uniref:Uncharacterized protein n=1 Tax=Arabis alpina TaxID=50452 RepID=A0A087HD57_ARAAL|nr:hypothetical protein AALP_AA3G325000 [Arabis alpina]